MENHQSNYQRIVQLQQTTTSLDNHLTELLTTLSTARTQLLSVPDTPLPKSTSSTPSREVPYTDLLSYASKISKFSQPPNPAAFRRITSGGAPAAMKPPTIGLSEEDLNQLDPSAMMPFTPWPSEDQMKSGALVALSGAGGVPEDMLGEEERRRLNGEGEGEKEEEEDGEDGGRREGPGERREVRREVERPKVSLSLDLYDPEDEE